MKEPDSILNALTESVIGAAIEVHKHLGPGYGENVYESALSYELQLRQIPFQRQVAVLITYKGLAVGEGRLDLLVADQLVVELKAIDALTKIHEAQILSYLNITGKSLGLLMNFNVRALKDGLRRFVLTKP